MCFPITAVQKIGDLTMYLLILGAGSDIARETAKLFASREGVNCYLAGRDLDALGLLATDLEIRYQVKPSVVYFDATDCDSHRAFYEGLSPSPDGVLLAFGLLGNQRACEEDFHEARRVYETNFTGAASILEIVGRDFERKGRGFLIAISSVAGCAGEKQTTSMGRPKPHSRNI